MTKVAGYYEITTVGDPTEPLSLEDAKAFLRVETDADDDLIDAMIVAARESGEAYTGRCFVPLAWRVSFPSAECGGWNEIQKAPITNTPTITEWNSATQTFDAVSDAIFTPSSEFGRVQYSSDIGQPTDAPFGIRMTFNAGYTALPKPLLAGLKMHVAYLYENRGDVEAIGGVDMPAAVKMLYRQYRIIATYG